MSPTSPLTSCTPHFSADLWYIGTSELIVSAEYSDRAGQGLRISHSPTSTGYGLKHGTVEDLGNGTGITTTLRWRKKGKNLAFRRTGGHEHKGPSQAFKKLTDCPLLLSCQLVRSVSTRLKSSSILSVYILYPPRPPCRIRLQQQHGVISWSTKSFRLASTPQ